MKTSSFLGIHNISPPRSIPSNALVDAVDVDITNSGALLACRGYAFSKGIPIDSAYSTQEGRCYVVSNGMIGEVDADLDFYQIAASIASEFTEFGNSIFTNDGLRIDGRNVVVLNLPAPDIPLSISVTGGDMPPGTYHVTYAYRNAHVEGGTAPIASITLSVAGGIYIAPPAVVQGHVATIYMTNGDGAVYYSSQGVSLNPVNVLADPFPIANKIAYHASRLYCAEGLSSGQTVIRFSQLFYFHLYDYLKDFFIVPGHVTGMMSAGSDLLISTENEIYAYSQDKRLQLLANYGTPLGKPMAKSPDGRVYLHTKQGICRAFPFENLTKTKASLPPGIACHAFIANQRGMEQFVALNDGGGVAFNRV